VKNFLKLQSKNIILVLLLVGQAQLASPMKNSQAAVELIRITQRNLSAHPPTRAIIVQQKQAEKNPETGQTVTQPNLLVLDASSGLLNNEGSGENCAICFAEFASGQRIMISSCCNNVICTTCSQEPALNQCPFCRTQLTQADRFYVTIGDKQAAVTHVAHAALTANAPDQATSEEQAEAVEECFEQIMFMLFSGY